MVTTKRLDGFEIFPWNKNFETGIAQIDAQHKRLVELLNQLGFYLAHSARSIELNEVFDALTSYADYHFKTEEAVWKKFLRDDLWGEEHLKEHSTFLRDITALRKGETGLSFDDMIRNILRFLMRWLVLHILGDDMRLARVVHGIESGLSLELAKAQADKEIKDRLPVLVDTLLQMYDSLSVRILQLMREKN